MFKSQVEIDSQEEIDNLDVDYEPSKPEFFNRVQKYRQQKKLYNLQMKYLTESQQIRFNQLQEEDEDDDDDESAFYIQRNS